MVDRKSRLHHQIKWFSDSKNGIVLIFDPIALVEEPKSYVEQQLPDLHHCCCLLCVNSILQNSQIKAPPKKHEFGFSQHQQTSKRLKISTSMYDDVCIKLWWIKSGVYEKKIKKLLAIDSRTYSHGQALFYKFVSKITNKLVKQLLSMTVLYYFRNP